MPSSSLIGSRLEELDTPALLLDGPAAERNLEKMAEFFRGRSCQLRPHFKNHKCATLARKQIEAGSAAGMTCAKLGEAEILAEQGFDDLLIANQVIGPRKIARLVKAAKKTNLKVAIDDIAHIRAISTAAHAAGATVGLLIEVDGGMGRCGVEPGRAALELAQQIDGQPGVRFDGLQCFEGHCVYVDDPDERAAQARASMQSAIETRGLIEQAGIPVGVISGGASSTYAFVGVMDGVDEVQAGTYATMDWRYHQLVPEFEVALSILTRVISQRNGVAIVDLGVKGAGSEFGAPEVKDQPGAHIQRLLSEEHCKIEAAAALAVGDAVQLIPSHACTTCNLYRNLVVHDEGRVVDVWPIEASGLLT